MTTYPFNDLEIGKAFTAPAGMTTRHNMAQLCQYHSKRLGRRFTYETNPDGSITVSRREIVELAVHDAPKIAIHDAPAPPRTRADILRDYDRLVDELAAQRR